MPLLTQSDILTKHEQLQAFRMLLQRDRNECFAGLAQPRLSCLPDESKRYFAKFWNCAHHDRGVPRSKFMRTGESSGVSF